MKTYTPQTFTLPELPGISQKQLEAHLTLYAGYVTHTNRIIEQIDAWEKEQKPDNAYLISELRRRFAFEFEGMRSHEYYFGALTDGPQSFDPESSIGTALMEQYGSLDAWQKQMHTTSMTRGSGWALLVYDAHAQQFIIIWIDEHHLGHLSSLPIILAIDCWEHAYMVDYLPSERAPYIDAYIQNLNWQTINTWFENVASK